jgi:hypothetical protein
MTSTNSRPSLADTAGDDQTTVPVEYGHGRMPGFMKVAWLLFLAFIAWYVTVNLLPALGTELGG